MIIRNDFFNSNPLRHLRQSMIILRGIQSRNTRADFANKIAQEEAANKTLQGIKLKDYMNDATGLGSLFR